MGEGGADQGASETAAEAGGGAQPLVEQGASEAAAAAGGGAGALVKQAGKIVGEQVGDAAKDAARQLVDGAVDQLTEKVASHLGIRLPGQSGGSGAGAASSEGGKSESGKSEGGKSESAKSEGGEKGGGDSGGDRFGVVAIIRAAREVSELDESQRNRVVGLAITFVGLLLMVASIVGLSTTKSTVISLVGLVLGAALAIGREGYQITKGLSLSGYHRRRRVKITEAARTMRIGRYADQIDAAYARGGGERRWSVAAPPGFGKSTLLSLVGYRAARRKAEVLFITVPEKLDTYYTCETVVDLISSDSSSPQVRDALEKAKLAAFKRLNEKDDLGALLAELSERVARVLAGIDRETVLLIDDFHLIVGSEAGAWVLALAERIAQYQHRLVVIAERHASGTVAFGVRVRLDPHTDAELDDEVKHRLARSTPDGVAQIKAYSAGVPFVVDLAMRRLRSEGPAALARHDTAPGAGGYLSAQERSAEENLYDLDAGAKRICGEFASGRRVSDWLAVLERFGGKYLKEALQDLLAEHEGLDRARADQLVKWLERQEHSVHSPDNDRGYGLQLLPYLREARLNALAFAHPERLEFLHAAVERVYWETINTDSEDLPRLHLQSMQLRFESADWHRFTLEWLNHAAKASRSADLAIARACSTLFFKRYFWYDLMSPTIYCTELVEQYRRRWSSAPWVGHVQDFRDGYVSGPFGPGWSTQHANDARWAKADHAAAQLHAALDLPDRADGVTEETREPFVYLNLLRIDALRFGHLENAALESLAEVRAANTEGWVQPWLDMLAGETRLELGQTDEAAELLAGLEAAAVEFEDNDLRCTLGVVLADLAWARGDRTAAIGLLTRSVLVAAAYHLQQECDGYVKISVPNEYSMLRHKQTADRLAGRLADLERADGKKARRDAEARISALFRLYWDIVLQGRSGAHPLVPPPPAQADLWKVDSAYRNQIRVGILDRMKHQLGKPLTEPLPNA